MKSAVIGLGETGRPLFELLQEHYGSEITGIDIPNKVKDAFSVLNICIPYSGKFVNIVEEYQERFTPAVTIIHSTVPIGTTAKLKNAVHSPILGQHHNMKHCLRSFPKWVGGKLNKKASSYLESAGFQTITRNTPEETEALKLMCLAKYGMSIAFAQYQKEICDTYKFSYDDVLTWDRYYNEYVSKELKRPVLSPPGDKIGGHCVIQNTKILNEQHPNKILEEILKYE